MNTLILFCFFWLFLVVLARFLPGVQIRKVFAAVPSLMVLTAAFTFGLHFSAAEKLLITFPALLYALKAGLLLRNYNPEDLAKFSKTGLLLYMTVWPGLDARPFERRIQGCEIEKSRFARGYTIMWIGALMMAATILFWSSLPVPLNAVAGLVSLLVMIHLGYTDVLTSLLKWWGWQVSPLFDEPWRSASLREFWSRRWNMAFVEMNRELFLPIFRRFSSTRVAVVLAFLLSGILHELAISYPASSTAGGPFACFLIQALACLAEPRLFPKGSVRNPQARQSILKRIYVWSLVLLPLPLLFTEPFLHSVISPLFESAHQLTVNLSTNWVLDKIIWLAAIGNFLTMAAGIQAPARLNWKDEFARLSTFNRKIVLNYYFFIGGVIGSWGLLTVSLHDDFLKGNHIAGLLACLITVFWAARLLVDAFYFKHSDWPSGSELVIGHALLNTLFFFLTAAYASLAIWCALPL